MKTDINQMHNGYTPLGMACSRGDIKMVKYLIKNGANPNIFKGSMTPLLWAIHNDNMEMVSILLKNGADPNLYIKDEVVPWNCKTALQFAKKRKMSDMVSILKEYGADENGNETEND